MKGNAQKFDPRQEMHGNSFEIFHYIDDNVHPMEMHYHDFYEVFFFLGGEVDYWIDGSVYHLKPGDILLINPLELHKPIPKGDTKNYERIPLWIDKNYLSSIQNGILENCFDNKSESYKKIMRPTAIQKQEIFELLYSLLKEYNSKDFGSSIICYGILLQIMTILNRISMGNNSQSPEKYRTSTLISEVLTYIGDHYSENLSLELIAKQFFVSKYYLSHEFSREVGTSVYRYITLKRLNIAHDMLKLGNSPGQVSHTCGFGDYTNFYRAFKSEYGISPSEVL